MTTSTPLHQAQIVRSLPGWSQGLHPDHTEALLDAVRRAYIDPEGNTYSWYATALTEERQRLQALYTQRDRYHAQLSEALAGFKGITDFCKPLLEQRLGLSTPVDKAQYVFQPAEQISNPWQPPPDLEVPLPVPGQHDVTTRPVDNPQYRSLLEAALHNFDIIDDTGPYDRLVQGVHDTTELPHLTPVNFVRICRQLDLGQQYQEHIQSIYQGPRQQDIQRLSIALSQQTLLVEAQIAWMKGLLSSSGRDALTQLCTPAVQPRYAGEALQVWRLSLFATAIHEVLLIGPDRDDQLNPCIVFIPGHPEHPIREYGSAKAARDFMASRLLKREFRQSIIGFTAKHDQAALARRLDAALFELLDDGGRRPRKEPKLGFARHPLQRGAVWSLLYQNQLQRLEADARAVAVPTADANAKALQERIQYWLDLGMSVLNVAAFCVPALNTVMLGVFAYDIVKSVFTGVEAWAEGDTAQALEQLKSLAINATVIAGFAVGARAVKASGFVDALQSVWHEGREVLWHAEMAEYASTVKRPAHIETDDMGLYRTAGKQYLELDGTSYEVFQDADNQWRIRHPAKPEAYAPKLQHQGEGRWKLDHEHPLEWDAPQALRRLGKVAAGLDDAALETALRCCGENGDVLRHTHSSGQKAPSLLVDTMLRIRADNEAQLIIDSVREGRSLAAHKNYALPGLLSLPGWPADCILKVFNGPEPWGDALYYGEREGLGKVEIEITRTDLENGHLSQTVLAQMNDQAIRALVGDIEPAQRAATLDSTLARSLETQREALFQSLLHSHDPVPGTEAQTLGRQFPGLPKLALEAIEARVSSKERKQLAAGRVPLRVAEEARALQAQARLNRALLGLARPTLATPDSQLLDQVLQAEYPRASAEKRLAAALANRQGCAARLGQQPIKPGFRSPLRLADGRVGYPLSGRGLTGAARRLSVLYPGLDIDEVHALRARLAQAGDLGTQIKRLEADLRLLKTELQAWASGPEAFDRSLFQNRLIEAWQQSQSAISTLELTGMQVSRLPELTVTLPHITTLKMNWLDLERIEPSFLACFPNVETLEIINNPRIDQASLFEAVQALGPRSRLRCLRLQGNNLQLDDARLRALASLPLDELDLSGNRITLTPDLASTFTTVIHPHTLRMAGNPLGQAPNVTFMARLRVLDLSHCELTTWPEGLTALMQQPQYQLRTLELSFNRIRTLPNLDQVLRSPFARDVAAQVPERRWLHNRNTLEATTRDRLRASRVNVAEASSAPSAELGFFQVGADDAQLRLWDELFDQGDNRYLLGALERLADSAEARNHPKGVRQRVWALLSEASQNTSLREHLEYVAQHFPATCGDAGTDAFSELEIQVIVHKTSLQSTNPAKQLLALQRKLFRRDTVNTLAERINARRSERQAALQHDVDDDSLPALDPLDEPEAFPDTELRTGLVDEIEVRLALRQSLATELDFPEPSRGMRYRATANVSQQIIDNVAAEVRRLTPAEQASNAWLLRQSSWTGFLKQQNLKAFNAITEFWRPGLDYLDWCNDDQAKAVTQLPASIVKSLTTVLRASPVEAGKVQRIPINDQTYIDGMLALRAEQALSEEGLLLSLTREVETLGS
ncbi:NEL-type E3 ubiquitin ligase domain-containing protein [Pseudomonas sp. BN607]|uniref:NEL-type E3 ubiquitin ligase domain-containing protein n=1 Tax=Pseudomonas sp. BN607 TaxID=2567895 RepID=UPI002454DF67|nr:NEL-type E3 ubiquitin ligase domain-containing protein [Pseudomonas sp. BN607]MDH4551945.1 hypothetical protein [Pseudomonas sp. BN607]